MVNVISLQMKVVIVYGTGEAFLSERLFYRKISKAVRALDFIILRLWHICLSMMPSELATRKLGFPI